MAAVRRNRWTAKRWSEHEDFRGSHQTKTLLASLKASILPSMLNLAGLFLHVQ